MSRTTLLFAFLIILLISLASASSSPPPPKKPYKDVKKLSVGIRKRAENCERKAKAGDKITVNYAGYLAETLEKFDASYDRGDPFSFVLGRGSVIQGWDAGLLGSCEGEARRLVIPYDLAYGERGMPPRIPAKSALVFDVEVLKIEGRDEL